MAKLPQTVIFALTLLSISGCAPTWVSEETRFYIKRDWQQLTTYDWAKTAKDVSMIEQIAPSPTTKEMAANQKICLSGKSEDRVTMQDGISDKAEYRRCVLAPYPDVGMRMKNRPEPQS